MAAMDEEQREVGRADEEVLPEEDQDASAGEEDEGEDRRGADEDADEDDGEMDGNMDADDGGPPPGNKSKEMVGHGKHKQLVPGQVGRADDGEEDSMDDEEGMATGNKSKEMVGAPRGVSEEPLGVHKRSKDKSQKGIAKAPAGGKRAIPGQPRSVAEQAGLSFPVQRFARALRKGAYCKRLALGASIYVTAVVEYITAEILELAGNAAKDHRKLRIIPRHIQLAIRNDEELNRYLSNVTIAGGGVLPNVHSVLLPRTEDTKAGKSQEF